MSSKSAQGLKADTIDEQAIGQYLQQHPDLFDRHPQLLTRLRLVHPRTGTTVSLIERQVEVLREKQAASEQKLADFVRVARANDALADKIHRFTRRLVRTSTRAQALAQVEASLREDFDAYHAVLLLPAGGAGAKPSDEASHFVRLVASDDPIMKSFESLFSQRQTALRPGARLAARLSLRLAMPRRYRLGGADPAGRAVTARPARDRQRRSRSFPSGHEH
jgi:uncharacterized protein YigA (DUF484 family)